MVTAEQLKTRATQISKSCKDALEWCSASSDESIRLNRSLFRELRTAVVSAEKLKFAATSKMAVGVFGPSQAGKSYLISALARSKDGSLLSSFGEKKEDFITKINPEGGKESTGLVTRFTYNPTYSRIASDFPVQVGLLTEIDIVKILANTFVEDLLHSDEEMIEDHQANIVKVIESAQNRTNQGTGISVEEVFDLENYIQSAFMKNTRMKALRSFGYWQTAIDVVPSLPPDARVEFFSALWEGIPTYTEIYRRLQTHLISLDFARQVACAPAVLFEIENGSWLRSRKSIIDVATLNDLCETPNDLVTVLKPSGDKVHLERSELTALVSELIINLTDCPHPFFKHTDLLDFPGARSRQPQPRERITDREVRVENFLRGKVAYLFERYSADRELSAMLLCVGPSNQNVVGLGELIERWIGLTHGSSSDERSKVACTLLFILTKFDTAFEQGAGTSIDGTRWATRLEASVLNAFGLHSHQTKWVSQWNASGKFKNLFWLRNPNFRQDALFTYGKEGVCQELAIREDKVDFIADLRSAFLTNSLVKDYFSDPADAWDKAMILNDGGISRIISAIEPICQPSVKLSQVEQQISMLATRVYELLVRFYISSDITELRKQQTELAMQMTMVLGNSMQKKRLGEFISSLKLDVGFARDAYYQSERAATTAVSLKQQPDLKSDIDTLDPDLAALLGFTSVNETPKLNKPTVTTNQDFARSYSENIFDTWLAYMTGLSRNENVTSYFGVTSQTILNIARELEVSARKCGLFDQMSSEIRSNRSFITDRRSAWVWKQIAPVTYRFNDFIDHAGNIVVAPSGITVKNLNDVTVQIFASLEVENPLSHLKDDSVQYEKTYLTDWLLGFQATVRTNADFLCDLTGNVDFNERLGEILNSLKTQV